MVGIIWDELEKEECIQGRGLYALHIVYHVQDSEDYINMVVLPFSDS